MNKVFAKKHPEQQSAIKPNEDIDLILNNYSPIMNNPYSDFPHNILPTSALSNK